MLQATRRSGIVWEAFTRLRLAIFSYWKPHDLAEDLYHVMVRMLPTEADTVR